MNKKTVVFVIECLVLAFACIALLLSLLDAYVVDIPFIYNRPNRPLGTGALIFAIFIFALNMWRTRHNSVPPT